MLSVSVVELQVDLRGSAPAPLVEEGQYLLDEVRLRRALADGDAAGGAWPLADLAAREGGDQMALRGEQEEDHLQVARPPGNELLDQRPAEELSACVDLPFERVRPPHVPNPGARAHIAIRLDDDGVGRPRAPEERTRLGDSTARRQRRTARHRGRAARPLGETRGVHGRADRVDHLSGGGRALAGARSQPSSARRRTMALLVPPKAKLFLSAMGHRRRQRSAPHEVEGAAGSGSSRFRQGGISPCWSERIAVTSSTPAVAPIRWPSWALVLETGTRSACGAEHLAQRVRPPPRPRRRWPSRGR